MKVLIVDDDSTSRLYLKSILQSMGHQVIACADGEEALEHFQGKDAPKLLIADWMMPKMTGIELSRSVKSNGAGSFVYSILVTSRNEREDILEAFRSGINDYIHKPFNSKEILPRIESAIQHIELNELVQRQKLNLISSSKMATLGEMAGGIAHEINNPLAIIQGNADILKELTVGEDLHEICDKIIIATTRVAKIVNGLRAFACEGDNDPFVQCSTESILDNTLTLCQQKFKNHRITIKESKPPHPIELKCRSAQISQALLNLLTNAYDAVSGLEDPWVEISVHDEKDEVILMVTDSGSGISHELSEKIMQPFFTTKEIGKGVGLGLSIARGIAISHGGSLILDQSSPNTRFVMRLSKEQNTK